MASGTPDYFQTVREVYGASESKIGVVTVTANDDTDLMEVSGKGVIYGGVVHLTSSGLQSSDAPHIIIDGEEISALNFATLAFYDIVKGYSNPFSLMVYDEVNFKYAVAINFGFTFESSFKVFYEENNGRTPVVICRAAYALL